MEENTMFNFDVPRYEKVVNDAIALRPQIEQAVDEIANRATKICSLSAAVVRTPILCQ